MNIPIMPQSQFQKDCGLRLRQIIELLDLKQTEAAEIMGVSKHVLRNWLAGDNPVQPYPLYRLCRAKRINFDWVFLGDWSRLPFELAHQIEAEALAKLADAPLALDPASSSSSAQSSREKV